MSFTGVLRAIDLGDDSALAGAYVVECEATRHARPGWLPLGEKARVAAWRADNVWGHELVGAFESGRMVGVAISSTAHDTPDTSWISVSVVPRHQGRGAGTRLVQEAERMSPAGVSRFVASAYRPAAADLDELLTRFARPLGYSTATTETVVELDLAGSSLPLVSPPVGYVLSTYVNGVPGPIQAQVGVLKGLVDAEAPSGDLTWHPSPVSSGDYQDEISLWQRQGRTAVESIAVSVEGVVAAWTCVVMTADPARPAQIEGTMVLTQHRGRRLGRVVKIASLFAARERGALRVRTSSDDQNVWMRAINDELGFVPVESEILLQKRRCQPAPGQSQDK
jgi:GNAT superfamily N-acetyltransferase